MSNDFIIHFTKKMKVIRNILSEASLRLSYSEEDFYLGNRSISSAAHPMVSFSKYDIKRLKNKVITYGKYGIAFSEEWQRANGINPVLYIDNTSSTANALAALLTARQNNETSKLPKNLRIPIMTLKCFTKNAIGFNSYLQIRDFKFYKEFEWRFVPKKKDIGNGYISLNRKTYINNKDYYNNKILPFSLRFNLSDIKVVYVQHQKEVNWILENFKLDKSKVKLSDWKLKESKFISNEQYMITKK